MSAFEPSPDPRVRAVWGVAALLLAAADALNARLGGVAVRGELSSYSRAPSGHCYFSLKDSDGAAALVRCAMFRRAAALLDFDPRDGLQVELRGRIGLYEPRGELQLVVESMRRLGAGSLYEEFLRLRSRLERDGLFDAARKRPIAGLPQRVVVVTSPAAAAWHDVMTAMRRRCPQVEVVLVPSLVQGADAPTALVAALQQAAALHAVDTVLLVRGGGSLEDLWAFNDERVVRAVAACPVPVICGVGHESDVTLCDLAADLRAPTPTAAAELASLAAADGLSQLASSGRRLQQAVSRQLDRQTQRLDQVLVRLGPAAAVVTSQSERLKAREQRLLTALRGQVPRHAERLTHLGGALVRSMARPLERSLARLAATGERLQALDPHAVLRRGFVWVEGVDGRPVLSVRQLEPGVAVQAVWSDGSARARIEDIKPGLPSRAARKRR